MNRYVAKTLFSGYKIGLEVKDMYVMVPDKKLDHTCIVYHDNSYMVIKKGSKPVKRYFQAGKTDETGKKIFPDFWGSYFKYEPYQNKTKKEEVKVIEYIAKSLTLEQIRNLKQIALGLK